MKAKNTCCFTGISPRLLPCLHEEESGKYLRLKKMITEEVDRLITENKVSHFISGMDNGVGLLAASIVIELKAYYPHITIECVLPYETQAENWRESQREKYYNILAECDKETMLQKQYTADCVTKSIMYMIDHSAYTIAIWNGRRSNTKRMIEYAKRRNAYVVNVDPDALLKAV